MPAGPPLSARLSAGLGRWALIFVRRVLPVLLVAGAVTGVALAVPVVSRAMTAGTDLAAAGSPVTGETGALTPDPAEAAPDGGAAPTSAPSSRWAQAEQSAGPVVMGVDGLPADGEPLLPTTGDPVTGSGGTPPATEDGGAPGEPTDAGAATAAGSGAVGTAEPGDAVASAASVPATDPAAEARVLALVNEAREQAGCSPLAADAGLAAVARAHSADMRDRDYFAHADPDGRSPFDRAQEAGIETARAENIAFGQPDPEAVMASWMASEGHRANILDCRLRTLGVGVAEGAGGPWWTQLFGG